MLRTWKIKKNKGKVWDYHWFITKTNNWEFCIQIYLSSLIKQRIRNLILSYVIVVQAIKIGSMSAKKKKLSVKRCCKISWIK
jgi:hypothetical protein